MDGQTKQVRGIPLRVYPPVWVGMLLEMGIICPKCGVLGEHFHYYESITPGNVAKA